MTVEVIIQQAPETLAASVISKDRSPFTIKVSFIWDLLKLLFHLSCPFKFVPSIDSSCIFSLV